MSIITKCRIHTAVYWPPLGLSQDESIKCGLPVEIKCRWDEGREEVQDTKGDTIVSTASVICDRHIKEGGYLYRGTLASLNGTTDPTLVDEAFVIRSRTAITKLRNEDFNNMDQTLVIAYL